MTELSWLLNHSLIRDPEWSYLAITTIRVVEIGTMGLAVVRVSAALKLLPRRARRQSWRTFLLSPWWRGAALMIRFGLTSVAVMLALQAFAGNIHAGFSQPDALPDPHPRWHLAHRAGGSVWRGRIS